MSYSEASSISSDYDSDSDVPVREKANGVRTPAAYRNFLRGQRFSPKAKLNVAAQRWRDMAPAQRFQCSSCRLWAPCASSVSLLDSHNEPEGAGCHKKTRKRGSSKRKRKGGKCKSKRAKSSCGKRRRRKSRSCKKSKPKQSCAKKPRRRSRRKSKCAKH
ncbi:histone-like protein 18C [Drosophila obscura]|uniref:histone-like protein 18C n=1 Tax=Drosophila obscura TaxID=7282 RepID=UPI001BB0ECDB|nr:histone-like protein 18C [Drosophila obscura]